MAALCAGRRETATEDASAAAEARGRTWQAGHGGLCARDRACPFRGVLDPFDPVAALPRSAAFLRDLRAQFGNLGLAAAAYNAGPKRVRDWLAGRSSLPGQTRSYVSTITGRSADDWARRRDGDRDAAPSTRPSCSELIALLKADPVLYADGSEPRVREYAEV
jgi:Transglycosylase SLT domain